MAKTHKDVDKDSNLLDNRVRKEPHRKRPRMQRVMFEFTLPATLKKRTNYWVSSCPVLDVFSQGPTKEEAKKNLEEALRLFIISCYERGTLETALKECGFSLAKQTTKPSKPSSANDFVRVPIYLAAQGRCTTVCHA